MKLRKLLSERQYGDLDNYQDRFRNMLNEFDAYKANIFDMYDTVPEELFVQFKKTRQEFVNLVKLLGK